MHWMASFDFAPLARRYAQDERCGVTPCLPEPFAKLRTALATSSEYACRRAGMNGVLSE